jgi:hypothetical protein
MISYQLTSTIIGLLIAGTILFLVRRDHMHGPYAIWWFCTAAMIVVLGLFPRMMDTLASRLGVNYPPIFVVILAIGLILIKILTMDLERSRQERKIRRLTQRLAMLEVHLPSANKTEQSSTIQAAVEYK